MYTVPKCSENQGAFAIGGGKRRLKVSSLKMTSKSSVG